MNVWMGTLIVSVPFRGLRGLEEKRSEKMIRYAVGFSPLPGFEGSGGSKKCSGSFWHTKFQSPSGV